MNNSALLQFLILALAQNFCVVDSANILFYAAVGSHSTRISKWPLMEALAEKGHSVTYLSVFKDFESNPKTKSKVKTYAPKKWADSMGPWEDHMNFYDIRKNGKTKNMFYGLFDFGIQACKMLYSDPEFVSWVKSVKFDLVVVEAAMNDCSYGMIHLWQAKFAIYQTSTVTPWMLDSFGLPDESSSITDMAFRFTSEEKMTFVERIVNAIHPIYFTLVKEYHYLPLLEEITRKGLGEEIAKNIPSFKEIERNNSLLFLTSHFSMDYPRSFPPNVVPVGGIAVTNKIKPLPVDIEKFINAGKSGFIFISFGTLAEFTNFDKSVQIEFINALREFPGINFVWKSSETIDVTTLPNNVFVTKWAPQQTLLAHPNIKAFIMHAGMGSVIEAIHSSVPCICVPVLSDQDHNADLIVRRGAGVRVEIVDMKQQQMIYAIREILHNKRHRQAMTTLTKVFKDRPTPPLENAVWWVEYLLRHDNINDYIVPSNVHQSWWKRRQIDVWLTVGLCLVALVTILLYVLYLSLKKILSIVLGGAKTKSKSKLTKVKKS